MAKLYDSQTSVATVANGASRADLPADKNRVGLGVAVSTSALATWAGTVDVNMVDGSLIVPLTVLTPGHPVCWLSFDYLGSAILGIIRITNNSGQSVNVGVTNVLLKSEYPAE